MATYSNLLRGSSGAANVAGDAASFKVSAVVDLSPNAKDNGNLLINDGAGVVGATDIIQVIQVPANCIVERVMWEVVTASDTIADANIGDGSNTSGWDDAIDMTSTAVTLGDGAYNNDNVLGKLYTSADTIDLEVITAGTHTTGVIRITAIMTPNVA